MPMWINFTLRITALKEILTLIEGNLAFHPFLNTVIGMTYDFLPFMILPIYNTIAKIDHSYIEAAKDLGAKSYRVFFTSDPTIVYSWNHQWDHDGIFFPSMTKFSLCFDMMYKQHIILWGKSCLEAIFSMYDWNNGSVISMILLILILLLSTITGESSDKEDNAYEIKKTIQSVFLGMILLLMYLPILLLAVYSFMDSAIIGKSGSFYSEELMSICFIQKTLDSMIFGTLILAVVVCNYFNDPGTLGAIGAFLFFKETKEDHPSDESDSSCKCRCCNWFFYLCVIDRIF